MNACVCLRYSCDGTCGDTRECIRCTEFFYDPDGPAADTGCTECRGEPICPECLEDEEMRCDECDAVRCREHLHELSMRSPWSHAVSMETFYVCDDCYERYTGRAA